MTTPKIRTAYRGGARVYIHPASGEEAYGVTSALNMEPKPFLKAWAAKMTAEEAFDHFEVLKAYVAGGDRASAVEWLKKASDRYTREAADFGTAAHSLMEARAMQYAGLSDATPSVVFYPSRWHEGLTAVLANFEEFLAEFRPEFLYMEETIWSQTHGYAGSFDAVARLFVPGGDPGGEIVFLDYKTSKSVYSSTGKQLAAYLNADAIVFEDGTHVPVPAADGGAVLWNRPEGWRLHPVRTDEEVFEQFLRDLASLKYEKTTAREVVGYPVNKGAQKRRRKAAKK